MKVYLIRHGETALKASGAYQGWIDEPLSAEGKKALGYGTPQGFGALTTLSLTVPGGWVYVSPLKRARETAALVLPYCRQVVVEDLKEMNFGDFEGRSPDEMKNDPAYRAWVDSGCLDCCPNGETKTEFGERTCAAVASLIDMALKRGDDELFIVAHGGTQMAVMETFVDPSKPFYTWLLDCGSGYILDTAHWQAERRLAWEDGVVDCVWRDSIPLYDRP